MLFPLILLGCSNGGSGDDGDVYVEISSASPADKLGLKEIGDPSSTYTFNTPYKATQSGRIIWRISGSTTFCYLNFSYDPNEGNSGKKGSIPFIKGADGSDGKDRTHTYIFYRNFCRHDESISRQLSDGSRQIDKFEGTGTRSLEQENEMKTLLDIVPK